MPEQFALTFRLHSGAPLRACRTVGVPIEGFLYRVRQRAKSETGSNGFIIIHGENAVIFFGKPERHFAPCPDICRAPAGAIVYYALVFETPILGVNQHLRVAVGQTNAADEPTAADLTAAAR